MMLPDSRLKAVTASGLNTITPACFTNEVVMMKKINRLIMKSSIGARSMPCSSLSGAWRRTCMGTPQLEVLKVMLSTPPRWISSTT